MPADNKWFTRVVVAAAVIDALASLGLAYPEVGKEKLAELAQVAQGAPGGEVGSAAWPTAAGRGRFGSTSSRA